MSSQYITANCHIDSIAPLTVPGRIIVTYDKTHCSIYQKQDMRIV